MRPYVSEPIQCFNCLRMGHKSGSCVAKKRCLLCSGNHNKNDCTVGYLKCAHCGGAHTANFKGCPIIAEARKIEKLRAYRNETYQEARRHVIESRGDNRDTLRKTVTEQKMDTLQQNLSYSRVLQSTLNNSEDVTRSGMQCRSQAVQTTADGFDEYDKCKNMIVNDVFWEKLKSCFVELLEAHAERESTHKKRTMVDIALKTHFGVEGDTENPASAISNRVDSTMVGNQPDINESRHDVNCQQDRVKNATQKRGLASASDDEGVLSDQNEDSDNTFQTVEKRQILVNRSKKTKSKKKKHYASIEDMEQREINIMSLNCRGISTKLGEIKLMMFLQKPDIVCFQETWLSKHEPKFINYIPIWKHRQAFAGGLGIMVRRGIQHQLVNINMLSEGHLECQAIKILLSNNNTLVLLNIYNQGKSISVEEFRHYMNQLGGKYIITGDLNAHTPVLTNISQKKNATGRMLEQVLLEDNICIMNPINMFTYLSPKTGKLSCLDIYLASPNIASKTEVEASTDVGSDHRAIKIKLHIKNL